MFNSAELTLEKILKETAWLSRCDIFFHKPYVQLNLFESPDFAWSFPLDNKPTNTDSWIVEQKALLVELNITVQDFDELRIKLVSLWSNPQLMKSLYSNYEYTKGNRLTKIVFDE